MKIKDKVNQTIASNIKLARINAGITQEELAKRTGYTDRSSIAKVEKGLVDLPQSKIQQFADALGVAPSYLTGWDEESSENETSPTEAGERKISNAELKFALWGDCADVDDDDLDDVRRYAAFVRERKKQK